MPEWPMIDNTRQYISFQEPWSNDNWLSLTESNLFKRGAFAKYQMKMIPLSAWVSLSVGALLIGPEYIAATVVTAASDIAALRVRSISARSTLHAAASQLWSVLVGRCVTTANPTLVPTRIREADGICSCVPKAWPSWPLRETCTHVFTKPTTPYAPPPTPRTPEIESPDVGTRWKFEVLQ